MATYSCDAGYSLNVVLTRTCGDDGIWTPNEPTCDRTFVICFQLQCRPGCTINTVRTDMLWNVIFLISKIDSHFNCC